MYQVFKPTILNSHSLWLMESQSKSTAKPQSLRQAPVHCDSISKLPVITSRCKSTCDKSSTPLLLANLNEFMRSNGFPTFEIIRRMTRIQDNGKLAEYSPWNDKNLVFIPAGKLGVIKNAYADNELRQEPGVTYSNYGRIRISQWGKGETDNSNGVEFTKAQSLSLPVITEINGIYSLTVAS